jgi:3D (Asp-Asp-Asp) domain-containing protein
MRRISIISIFFLLLSFPKKADNPSDGLESFEMRKDYETVKVTTYTVDENMTDDEPTVTASGFKVDSLNPKKHRIIAVSRDLKRKYKFGQRVRVTGIGRYRGVYTVRDLMNRRWRKKIDILINPDEEPVSFKEAKIYSVNTK